MFDIFSNLTGPVVDMATSFIILVMIGVLAFVIVPRKAWMPGIIFFIAGSIAIGVVRNYQSIIRFADEIMAAMGF